MGAPERCLSADFGELSQCVVLDGQTLGLRADRQDLRNLLHRRTPYTKKENTNSGSRIREQAAVSTMTERK
jgi:hypothetical protein